MNVVAWLAAVPGVAALVAMLVGYGALQNRVKNVEDDLRIVHQELSELRATTITVARIDERTKATQEQVGRMDGKLDDALSTLLGETRTWRDRENHGGVR